jgi:hypothetical protein
MEVVALRITRLFAAAAVSALLAACNGNGAGNAPPFPAPSPGTQSLNRQVMTRTAPAPNAQTADTARTQPANGASSAP